MVTQFNSSDVIGFANYVLDKVITGKLDPKIIGTVPIDMLHEWKDGISFGSQAKFEYFCQKQELPIEGSNYNNPQMDVMGALGWELCGIHEGTYVYKRQLF